VLKTAGSQRRSYGSQITPAASGWQALLRAVGKFIGREDEWARLEHEIIRAGREGRILGALEPQGR
jgi:hypothetical protein